MTALEPGSVTISIDLEMLWGVWDNPPAAHDRFVGEWEREICAKLLSLFERYQVRCTWAVVGKLFDPRADHSGRGSADGWFAPEVVERVARSSVNHEIASHTYGHIYFGKASESEAHEDLERARELHRDHSLGFTSLVFPRNQVGHLAAVRASGLTKVRTIDQGVMGLATRFAPRLRPVVNLVDKACALPPPVVTAERDPTGIVMIPSSLLFLGRSGIRRLVTPWAMRRKLRLGLDRARATKQLFHLWFHPSNFYFDRDTQFATLDWFLGELRHASERGEVTIKTMAQANA